MINERIEETHAYYATNRSVLLKLIRGTPMRVLEIGCGAGTLIKELKISGCDYVCGIEIREDVALEALKNSGADRIVVANIETDFIGFAPESFDLIIASHVLEHLVDPWKVTNQLAGLNQGGNLLEPYPMFDT